MSKPIVGDPAADERILVKMRKVVTEAEELAVELINIRNLDESSAKSARMLLNSLENTINTIGYQIEEHSRKLLRQAIGGK